MLCYMPPVWLTHQFFSSLFCFVSLFAVYTHIGQECIFFFFFCDFPIHSLYSYELGVLFFLFVILMALPFAVYTHVGQERTFFFFAIFSFTVYASMDARSSTIFL